MALVKSTAIVLHHRDQGETSKIVTLFTRQYGKISLIAKGARVIKSRYGGALEPFTHLDAVFYKKETRDLQFLSQVDIIHPFPVIRSQLGRIALASIPCEMVDRHEAVGHAAPELFTLLLETLTALNEGERGLRNVVRAFQVKFAALSGFRPQLAGCSVCGRENPPEQVVFEYETGGYRCAGCPSSSVAGFRLSGHGVEILRYVQNAPVRLAGRSLVGSELGRNLDECLMHFIGYHMENLHHLASVAYFQQLQRSIKIT